MRTLPNLVRSAVLLALLACCGAVLASPQSAPPRPTQSPAAPQAAMPAWEQLTPEQRALLIAPVRERWNDSPERRAGLYEHARRWQSMTPEQRKNARRGKQRWDKMDPAQRTEARALFDRMRDLPPDQRKALREQWKAMTPEQRREWVRENGAAAR